MSESSIIIANDSSGTRLAVRSAFEKDNGNDRFIERVDFASGKFDAALGDAIRGNSSMISTADSTDLTNLPSDLTNNLITVGDNSVLIVFPEHSVSNGSVTITPLLYNNDNPNYIVGMLSPKTSSVSTPVLRRGSSSGNYISPALSWDILGAYKVGLHISAISGTSNSVKLYGYVI